MAKTSPYQSFLLRLCHGLTALVAIAAWFSGFWVYDNFDHRWLKLGLPKVIEIQDIHGTIAVIFLMLFPVLALYSLRIGYRRLLQPQSLENLKQFNQPVWWFTLHRGANTIMLGAGVAALITGRMMDEKWLPSGELNHLWYFGHLGAWLLLLMALALHGLMAVKVGGIPLLLSMVQGTVRPGDNYRHWWQEFRKQRSGLIFTVLEIIIFGGIAIALILPAFK